MNETETKPNAEPKAAAKVVRREFADALKTVGISASSTPEAPLDCVEVSALSDGIGLRACDAASETRDTCACAGDPPDLAAPLLVDHAKLAAFANAVPSDTIDLVLGGDLTLAGGGVRFALRPVVGELPQMPSVADPTDAARVSADELARAIGAVARSAAKSDPTRRAITAVRLDAEDGRLVAVATDGRRLASLRTAGTVTSPECSILIPAAFAARLRGVLDRHGNAEVRITADRRRASFEIGGGPLVRTRLVDETYPDWRRLRTARPHAAAFDAAALADAVRCVRTAVSDVENRTVGLTVGRGIIGLRASDFLGDARATCEIGAKTDDAEPVRFLANPDYLLDALAPIEAKSATLSYSDGNGLFAISDGDGYEALVMPMRIA